MSEGNRTLWKTIDEIKEDISDIKGSVGRIDERTKAHSPCDAVKDLSGRVWVLLVGVVLASVGCVFSLVKKG